MLKNLTIAEQNIEKAKKFINLNYGKKLYLSDVSNYICYNPYYFSKLFKKITGINFTCYLNKVRINKSKEYLKDFSLSIKEVSQKVGYEDSSYFTVIFKKIEGVLPNEYRKNNSK